MQEMLQHHYNHTKLRCTIDVNTTKDKVNEQGILTPSQATNSHRILGERNLFDCLLVSQSEQQESPLVAAMHAMYVTATAALLRKLFFLALACS